MKILRFVGAGLLSATLALARRVAFPLLFLGAGLVLVQPCAGASGVFDETGSLATARYSHTATLLPNGKVLVAGGINNNGGSLASAELYDPANGTWTGTGTLGAVRDSHTATLLPNGKVVVAGGYNGGALASAELYDPANGIWTATGSLSVARYYYTATLLPNGKVLVAGGINLSSGALASAELYDPASGIWTATGSLGAARDSHTATLLPDGKVLVAGGIAAAELASAELYDPANGIWTATGSLGAARDSHTATLLPDGKVLVAGGIGNSGDVGASAELYDPASGSWTATGSLDAGRYLHTATLLPNGKVLVAGGIGTSGLAGAELYDPASGIWTATGSLSAPRYYHTATLLPDGKVLVAGGHNGNGVLASAELYVGQPTPPTLLNISTRLRVLTDDNVLIGGFIITGTDPKEVLIRGIGPSLSSFGIAGALADPTLELHQGSTTVATNDNWKTRPDGSSQQAEIEATTIPPTNDLESAILATLSPGAYTTILAGKNRGTGVGSVEVYDLAQGANSQLANISARGFVDTGDNVMIGGLIIGGGTGGGTARVIVRALGPSVPVAGALGDPTLELRDSSGALVASNDNWKTRPDGSSQQAEIEATNIPPTNDLESALVQTLPPGNYTTIVRGKNSTTGVGLVEVYNLQ
jgi:N-acetylneuraminic acid mutarotase